MQALKPILVSDLFNPTLEALLQLLGTLTTEEWQQPTVCADWNVKQVALHLLAVDISNISRKRDGFSTAPQQLIRNEHDLLEFINTLNQDWIRATARISTPLLIDLLRLVGEQANAFFTTVDPFALGEPISWAGPEPAPQWLDLAREYTERWHHQQHIRDAVGKHGLMEPRFLAPVLDAFIRAMPYTYREVSAVEGICVTLCIAGDSGGEWTIRQEKEGWQFYTDADESPDAEVTICQDDSWRLFTKGIDPNQVRSRASIKGDDELASKIFQMVSIIA